MAGHSKGFRIHSELRSHQLPLVPCWDVMPKSIGGKRATRVKKRHGWCARHIREFHTCFNAFHFCIRAPQSSFNYKNELKKDFCRVEDTALTLLNF
jgi:hypothetical protein